MEMDNDTLADYWRDVSPILKQQAIEKRENETHRTCFNNDLLAIRIKEIKKMIEDENN